MTSWPLASVWFFAYTAIVVEWPPRSSRTRSLVWAGSSIGAALAIAASRLPEGGPARGLLLPIAVLLTAYWTAGLLFVRPMPRAERLLAALDEGLRIDRIARGLPRVVAEILECAYSGVYPFVLIALVYSTRAGVTADRFWSAVLVTDFICFGMLPWVQTRPPRRVMGAPAWRSSWRALNERLLDASSVQVNTFPSGHAAEALVAALLLTGSPGLLVAAAFVMALAVSAGAVLGRYHYALDAITGWLVALGVFYCLST